MVSLFYTKKTFLMKTTTEIIQHFLRLHYLDLAVDGRYDFSQLIGKSNKGEEIEIGDFFFNYIDRGYENIFEIPDRIKKFFPALPQKEFQHLYEKSQIFCEEFDRSTGLIDAELLFMRIKSYSENTFLEKDFMYDLNLWEEKTEDE